MQLDLFDNTSIPQNEIIPVISLEDIFNAYYECRKHKRRTREALRFELDLENNLITLWQEIINNTWEPQPSTVFIVKKPVTREIFAASFRDRIVHHLVIGKLNPLFEKYFIYDSYSCRKGKGTHFGVSRALRFIRRCNPSWILKIDIRGYFMSIDQNILYKKLMQYIHERYFANDKEMIKQLCKKIIFNDPTIDCKYHSPRSFWDNLPRDKSLFTAKQQCGLPIGNLTSQVFANFYLTEFDHFIKRECGIKNYGRYVDDCLLVHHSHSYLKKIIPQIKQYLHNNLGLTLHPCKIYLQPNYKGVKFLGCFIKPSHVVNNHRTIKNFKQKLSFHNKIAIDHKPNKTERSAFISFVNSYLGIMKHYKSWRQRRNIMANNVSHYWYKHTILLSQRYEKVLKKR